MVRCSIWKAFSTSEPYFALFSAHENNPSKRNDTSSTRGEVNSRYSFNAMRQTIITITTTTQTRVCLVKRGVTKVLVETSDS